jgi:hypothetical protein
LQLLFLCCILRPPFALKRLNRRLLLCKLLQKEEAIHETKGTGEGSIREGGDVTSIGSGRGSAMKRCSAAEAAVFSSRGSSIIQQ